MTQAYVNRRFADQGFCDSYTRFRESKPGKAHLALSMLGNAAMIPRSAVAALVRYAGGSASWRIHVARTFYFRNRITYDLRLLRSEEWRRFALQDNWITGD